jgi:hypothetical protein
LFGTFDAATVYRDPDRCCRATAKIADLIITGNEGQIATSSASSESVAAIFAALLRNRLIPCGNR